MPEFLIWSLIFAAMMIVTFLLGWFGRLSIGRRDLRSFSSNQFVPPAYDDMEDEFTPKPQEQARPFDAPHRYSAAGTPEENVGPEVPDDTFKE